MDLHLFIAGTGGVGKALLTQIRNKHGFLCQNQDLNLVVNGIINSRWMRLSREGISLDDSWEDRDHPECREADLSEFISYIQRLQISNALFVDVSASDLVAATYLTLLQHGVHVVACNKIACSAPMSHYTRLKAASQEGGAAFLYHTNVGAALPYLQSIRQLYLAGERIDRMEAVLSGTLSYLFGRYDGSEPFAQIVRQAHQAGYTEPDPRTDLQGIDVMRKLLILCREMGVSLEEKEVVKTPFVPESCLQGSLEDFYAALACNEAHFKRLYQEAQSQGGRLKYIASYGDGKAAIGLQCILPDHPIYPIGPKENILLIYSENYISPLTITGAGAGAQGTAMGVLSDIVAIAHDYF